MDTELCLFTMGTNIKEYLLMAENMEKEYSVI